MDPYPYIQFSSTQLIHRYYKVKDPHIDVNDSAMKQ